MCVLLARNFFSRYAPAQKLSVVESEESGMPRVYGNPFPEFTNETLRVFVMTAIHATVSRTPTVSQLNRIAHEVWPGGGTDLQDMLSVVIRELAEEGYIQLLGSSSIFENLVVRVPRKS